MRQLPLTLAIAAASLSPGVALAQGAAGLPADAPPPPYRAVAAQSPPRVDGRLDDAAWRDAPALTGFRQVEPDNGAPARFETVVRLLYDRRHLYVGVFARDPLGRRGVRVRDLRRKFDYFQNDLFGVSLDPLLDGRNSVAFQVTPYGSQRDLQVFDGSVYNREWEGAWRVRTEIADSGWTAEIAIPWATLRYDARQRGAATDARQRGAATDAPERGAATAWGANFYRVARRANETSAWRPWPRNLNAYRMDFAGRLDSLVPPPPRRELRVRPYVLAQGDRQGATRGDPSGATALTAATDAATRVGGELTWAPTPGTVLDLTANTDFAQAEVDRQVVNTTRFSVFFPERRQFFLEGGSLFDVGPSDRFVVRPFFSRRVGLDDAGTPIAIRGGARLVRRDAGGGDGFLVVRQAGSDVPGGGGPATFGVGRVSRNVGAGGRLGALVAARGDAAGRTRFAGTDSARRVPDARSVVGAVDGFARLGPTVSLAGMASAASAAGGRGVGVAAHGAYALTTNTLSVTADAALVTRDYDPPTGFVSRADVLTGGAVLTYDWRPSWRPPWLRRFLWYAGNATYAGASDRRLQESRSEAYVDLWFQNGALIYPDIQHYYQRLTSAFSPVPGVRVAPGTYTYWRPEFYAGSDPSAAVSGGLELRGGRYFDRTLDEVSANVRVTPSPFLAAALSWDVNRFRDAPNGEPDVTTHLVAPELRLALNPRVQLTTFYQYNTAAARGALNARFSWEFAPLSYVYFVLNDLRAAGPDARSAGPPRPAQQAVLKVVWLRQL